MVDFKVTKQINKILERYQKEGVSKMAVWSTAEVNKFPDSSFAWIAPGGKKDKEGKTVPRSLRHLPYKDANGKVDLPHTRNALARLNQVKGMPSDVQKRVRAKLEGVLEKSKKTSKMSKEGENKMAEETKISKMEDEQVKVLKEIVDKMKKVEGDVKAEDFAKYVQELEGVITAQPKEEKKEEEKKDAKEADKDAGEGKESGDKPTDDKPDADGEKKPDDAKPDTKDGDNKEADAGDKEADKADDGKKADTPDDAKDGEGDAKADETSKQSEIDSAYKKVANEAVSKLKEVNEQLKIEKGRSDALMKDNLALKEKISKFEVSTHNNLVEDTLTEMSKFSNLKGEALEKKKDEISKMSDSALEIMKAQFKEMNVSKMGEEQDPVTVPSQDLNQGGEPTKEEMVAKMEQKEILKSINGIIPIKKKTK